MVLDGSGWLWVDLGGLVAQGLDSLVGVRSTYYFVNHMVCLDSLRILKVCKIVRKSDSTRLALVMEEGRREEQVGRKEEVDFPSILNGLDHLNLLKHCKNQYTTRLVI